MTLAGLNHSSSLILNARHSGKTHKSAVDTTARARNKDQRLLVFPYCALFLSSRLHSAAETPTPGPAASLETAIPKAFLG